MHTEGDMYVRRLVRAIVGVPVLVALAAMASVSPARAAGTPNISGTWRCCDAGGAGHQRWVITDSSGKLSGHGGGGGYSWPIRGQIAGSSARIVTGPYKQVPSYTATFRGTVSASNTLVNGTWTSTWGQSGTFTAVRIGAAPAAVATSPSTITSSVPTLLKAFGSAGAVMAVGAVLFLTFPFHLFNLTFEGNHRDISAWWMRQRRRIPGLLRLQRRPAATASSR
jgi:hypothetical protein